ncbi:DEAD-box ATP-dependent RNA helicase 20-like [Pyrus ussuriensis x Pyrus communis]|uniref:DEAD-box ATP-dependent RNA helicase 20-like n=1 Tax=Pyrus ussuriensis x Pyrus communis TaxID=2448454 RepID=A0A5N5FW43_9ROSA|nr:DEAD-box ATP-dependent RNA helicase 20-like [Pyrus ussuriensis x Pyrus communis]
MVKRSNDPNEKRSRTRRRLNAVGDGDGDAAQGTSKVRNGRVQLGTKFATLLRVKESTRQRKRKRREITTSVEVQECRHRVKEYRQLRGISVSSSNVPKPIRTLGRTPFPEYVKDEFSKAGFVRPTPIQAQAWPVALEGRDFIGIAPPGSGKTLAYLLPAIVHVKSQKRLCVGILIDTPEAVLHELESCHTNLQRVTYLVVDGADWMLAEEDVAEEGEDCKVLVREVLSQHLRDILPGRSHWLIPLNAPKCDQPLIWDSLSTRQTYRTTGFPSSDAKTPLKTVAKAPRPSSSLNPLVAPFISMYVKLFRLLP